MGGTRVITKKTAADFDKMKVAGACVAEMHAAVRGAVAPGVTTGDLDGIAREVLAEHGCRSSFLGYGGPNNPFPGVLCTSPNSVIVHGIPDDHALKDGDIISIDAGAIYEGWHGDAAFTMAVGDVPEEVANLLDVTERALWAGIEQAKAGNRLGDIGVGLAIDDFGAGKTSLAHLRTLPVTRLKIDRSLVRDLDGPDAERVRMVLRTLADLAGHLEIDVVAEGVEDPEHRDALVRSGIALAQGFLFGRPAPPLERASWPAASTPRAPRAPLAG